MGVVAYTVSSADFGGLSVARLAAPDPDTALPLAGSHLHNVAAAILTDAEVSLDGPRHFILHRFVDDNLSIFLGKRSTSVTLRQEDVVAWAANLRAMIAPLPEAEAC